ncbi:MAG: NADH-quinone oxidoreductase subunit N [Bacteroidia bacterium]
MNNTYLAQVSEFTSLSGPFLLILATALILMLLDAFKIRKALNWTAMGGLALSAVWAWTQTGMAEQTVFWSMLEVGGRAAWFHIFLSLSGLFSLFFIQDYLKRHEKPISDVYALVAFAVLGMIMLANGRNLLMTFIGLETMSMCLYIFASLYKTDARSNEAGLKYFLLGSFASAFLLLGISLIYGISGTVAFAELGEALASPAAVTGLTEGQHSVLMLLGMGLILVGFLFKVAAFPFHNWAPDVYTGTPTPLAGFMATGSKMAAFIALAVIMQDLNFLANTKILYLLMAVSLLTMVYGNIVAARQQNVKRMLAYSSIAHAGYVLLGLCAGEAGFMPVVFYMFIYTLMNIGAFGMVSMVERDFPDTNMDSWRGLGQKAPAFAAAMSVFMLSLAGIPPLAGFMAKYLVFAAAINQGLIVLAVLGILASVIGAYYYLRLIATMFFSGKSEDNNLQLNYGMLPAIGAAILVALVIMFGIFPGMLLDVL